MSNYEFDQENYLHYTRDGWVTTTRPLTEEERVKFEKGKLDYFDFEWR